MAAKLGIADILSNGSKTVDELAKATGVNSRSIYHLMGMLSSVGVFSTEDNDKFQLNPMGKHLLTGTSDFLRVQLWRWVMRYIRRGAIYYTV